VHDGFPSCGLMPESHGVDYKSNRYFLCKHQF
jgi:hypothetical protein